MPIQFVDINTGNKLINTYMKAWMTILSKEVYVLGWRVCLDIRDLLARAHTYDKYTVKKMISVSFPSLLTKLTTVTKQPTTEHQINKILNRILIT